MGLRKKAQKYLELLISDRLDRLEEIYEGQNLSKEELLEIKGLISKKIFQTEREFDRKIDILETILSLSKKLENISTKSERLDFIFYQLKEKFCVKKALFFETKDEKSIIKEVLNLPKDTIGKEIEWSIQESETISKGETDVFDNMLHFHNIVPESESYLLVPIKIQDKIYGGFIIFLIEEIKCFTSKENLELFEWIAYQFAYPYFFLD